MNFKIIKILFLNYKYFIFLQLNLVKRGLDLTNLRVAIISIYLTVKCIEIIVICLVVVFKPCIIFWFENRSKQIVTISIFNIMCISKGGEGVEISKIV